MKVSKARIYGKKNISPDELFSRIREDFRRGYLFSGDIDPEIYEENCVFTDPTLTFSGLTTFLRNIQSLQPVLNYFLRDRLVVLYSLKNCRSSNSIEAKWRMSGDIALPWNPRIELTGKTKFSYTNKSGRIYSYYENWDISATDALLQLIRPVSSSAYNIPKGSNSILVEDTKKIIKFTLESLPKVSSDLKSMIIKYQQILSTYINELTLSSAYTFTIQSKMKLSDYRAKSWKFYYLPSLNVIDNFNSLENILFSAIFSYGTIKDSEVLQISKTLHFDFSSLSDNHLMKSKVSLSLRISYLLNIYFYILLGL
jgi:hypothetical protein